MPSLTFPANRQYDHFAHAGLFLLGICATLYLPLTTVGSFVVRPVQLAPAILGVLTLLFACRASKGADFAYFLAPITWAVYMGVRHFGEGIDGMTETVRSSVNLIAYLTALHLCRLTGSERSLARGLIVGCILSMAASAAHLSFDQTNAVMGDGRWQGFMPGANRLGNLCGVCLFLGVLELLSRRSTVPTVFYRLVVGLSVVGAVMSGSRGALLAAGLAICCLLVIRECATGRSAAVIRLLVAGLVLVAVVRTGTTLFRDQLPARVVALVEIQDDAVDEVRNDPRGELFAIAWDYFLSDPIFGAGAEARFFSMGNYESSTHDAYLYLLSTSGLVGLGLFLSLPAIVLLRLLKIAWRLPVAMRVEAARAIGAATLLVFVALHALVIDTSQSVHSWLVFAVASHVCIDLETQLFAGWVRLPGVERVCCRQKAA